MLLNIAVDIARLGLFIACAFVLLGAFARRLRPQWSQHLTQRRLAVLGLLTTAAASIKLIEDVVAQETGPVDQAILWFIRGQVPAALNGFFAAATASASAKVLVPLAATATAALLLARHRFEAALVAGSLAAAALVVWALKAIVGRARPALWEAQWAWGSSFPSGHTLSTAALSTAAALCVARLWPRAGTAAMAAAGLWTGAVALSRLVLGVHWPSDVLVALCLGANIALLISVVHDLAPIAGCPSPGVRRQ